MSPLRFSVRTRLAAMFGGMFLLAGAILLFVNYVLVNRALPSAVGFVASFEPAPDTGATSAAHFPAPAAEDPSGGISTDYTMLVDSISDYRASTLQTLLVVSGIALVIAGAIAALLGWLLAGRALRPLHKITATARRLEAQSMSRRINLDGPHDELKELADTFDGMLDRLAVAFDSQRRFVANASHELRTPLAVQRTLVEVAMADPTAGPELLRLGQHLLHTNERSEQLIDGLLVLARSDRGLVSRVPVRLDQVTETVLRASTWLAAEQGVAVSSELEPRTVIGDPVLLERLVTNLVHNAIQHNDDGGSVRVVVGADPALLVTNTGPEVPTDAVPGLFEPFRRMARERTRGDRNNGAGLGLSIVRSVAQAHEGTVDAAPNPDGGLRVAVHLRAAVERSDQATSRLPAAADTLGV